MTVKEMYISVIGEAIKAAGNIIEQDKKAVAYAEIAKALAMTGLVEPGTQIEETESKQTTVAATGKDALKNKPNTAKKADPKPVVAVTPAPVVDPAPAPVAEASTSDVVMTEEWNEQMQTLKGDDMKYLMDYIETEGTEAADKMVKTYSEGQLTNTSEITPMNITAFVFFAKQTIKEEDLKYVQDCAEAWGPEAIQTAIDNHFAGSVTALAGVTVANATGLATYIKEMIKQIEAAA